MCNISLPGVIPSPALIEAATVSKEGFKPIHLSSDKIKEVLELHGEIELQSVRDPSDLRRIKSLRDLIGSQGDQFGDCYGSRIRQIVAQTSEEQSPICHSTCRCRRRTPPSSTSSPFYAKVSQVYQLKVKLFLLQCSSTVYVTV